MDSTACLVRSDAAYVDLPFQFLPAGQRHMQEDNPITRHRKLQLSPVAARFYFLHFREYRTHPRVRHVGLNRDARTCNRFAGGIAQLERNRGRANPGGFRRDLVLNRDKVWRFNRSGAGRHQQGYRARDSYAPSCKPLGGGPAGRIAVRQLLPNRGGPIRRYRPGSRAHLRVETRGNTWRSPSE
jgi:hypothetical protein